MYDDIGMSASSLHRESTDSLMYKDETGHIRLIVVLQWGNKGGEGEGEVG